MGDSITDVLSLIIHDWNISHVWIERAGAGRLQGSLIFSEESSLNAESNALLTLELNYLNYYNTHN